MAFGVHFRGNIDTINTIHFNVMKTISISIMRNVVIPPLLVIMVLIMIPCFSQNQARLYSSFDESSEFSFHLTLSDENEFCIESHYGEEDVIEVRIVSYGQYVSDEDGMILTDEFHGYKTYLQEEGGFLVVRESLGILKDMKFFFRDRCDMPEYEKPVKEKIEEERRLYNKTSADSHELRPGLYVNYEGYELSLTEDGSFNLKYKDIFMSSGKWERDRNILMLEDSINECLFYLLIGEKNLISKLLPLDCCGCVLKKMKDPVTDVHKNRGFGCSRRRR